MALRRGVKYLAQGVQLAPTQERKLDRSKEYLPSSCLKHDSRISEQKKAEANVLRLTSIFVLGENAFSNSFKSKVQSSALLMHLLA